MISNPYKVCNTKHNIEIVCLRNIMGIGYITVEYSPLFISFWFKIVFRLFEIEFIYNFRSCHTQSALVEDDQICGVLGSRSTLCQYS